HRTPVVVARRRARLTPGRGTAQARHRAPGHPGGRTREEQRPQRCAFLVMRIRLPLLFAPPGPSLGTPGCSLEALAMTADERDRERGREEVEGGYSPQAGAGTRRGLHR